MCAYIDVSQLLEKCTLKNMTSFGLKAKEVWSAEASRSSREMPGLQPITSDLQAEKRLWELKGLLSHFHSKTKILHSRARIYKGNKISGRGVFR